MKEKETVASIIDRVCDEICGKLCKYPAEYEASGADVFIGDDGMYYVSKPSDGDMW